MPQSRRSLITITVLAVLLATATQAQAAGPLHAEKEGIVRKALEQQGTLQQADDVLAGVAQAHALLDLAMRSKPGEPDVTVVLAGTPEYHTFMLDGGRRFVMDLDNTINLQAGKLVNPETVDLIKAVRTSLFELRPRFVSRVVLDLTVPCAFAVDTSHSGQIRLELQPKTQSGFDAGANPQRHALVRVEMERHEPGGGAPEDAQHRAEDAIPALARELEAVIGGLPCTARSEAPAPGRSIESLKAMLVELKAEAPGLPRYPESGMPELRISSLARELREVRSPAIDLAPGLHTYNAAIEERSQQEERPVRAPADPPAEPEPAPAPEGEDALPPATPDDGEEPVEIETAQPVEAEETEAAETEPAVDEDEETPAQAEPAAEDAPEPPEPRVAPQADTTGANQSIASKMLELMEGLTGAGEPGAAAPAQAEPASVEAKPAQAPPKPPERKPYKGDPLMQPVDVDVREMELANVVAVLAYKAGINVIAGTDLTGVVTANLTGVPLKQAMETVLRMNGLGLLEEEGIFRIVPYDEAMAAERTTSMVKLENAKAAEVRTVLEDVIKGSTYENRISLASNDTANVLVVAGPDERVSELVNMAEQLDVAEPVLPTVTEAVKLNYAEPNEVVFMVEKMLTPEVGNIASDTRARHLIITDVPVVVEQIRALIQEVDIPVKQVVIESMVVDVVLDDAADTGVDWLLEAVRRQSRRQAVLGDAGRSVGNLQDLSLDAAMPIENAAGLLNFSILSSDIDWSGVIQAEVRNRNGRLISNPVLVTVENKPATISIAQEIPYVELTQTDRGGQQTNTEFKEVGTVLTVTPAVTHDDHIIVDLDGKESGTTGEFNGVPIEDKREISSTLHLRSGQTIFVGGLRKNDKDTTVRKIPVLGDVPVVNFLFRSNSRQEAINELLIFLTCNVVDDELPELTPYQAEQYEDGKQADKDVNVQQDLVYDMFHPGEMRDPIWKWRKSE